MRPTQERPSEFKQLVPYWKIFNEECKNLLEEYIFKKMDKEFDRMLYRELLFKDVIDINHSDYFERLILEVNRTKGNGAYKKHGGKPELMTSSFINFILLLYITNVDLNDKRLKLLTNLCDWQEWLVNLETFDYTRFKSEWLLLFFTIQESAFRKFAQIDAIKEAVRQELKKEYQPKLAEIYTKFLC